MLKSYYSLHNFGCTVKKICVCVSCTYSQLRSHRDRISVLEVLFNCSHTLLPRALYEFFMSHCKTRVQKSVQKNPHLNFITIATQHSRFQPANTWTPMSSSKYFKIMYKDEWIKLLILPGNINQNHCILPEDKRWHWEMKQVLLLSQVWGQNKLPKFLTFLHLLWSAPEYNDGKA